MGCENFTRGVKISHMCEKFKLQMNKLTDQNFLLLLFKILWVLSTEKGEHATCHNVKLTQHMRACRHVARTL